MNKIALIIRREFLTRVRKKSFIIMSLIGPLISGLIISTPFWLYKIDNQEKITIAVLEYDTLGNALPDNEQLFKTVLHDHENLRFSFLSGIPYADIPDMMKYSSYSGFLIINQQVLSTLNAKVEYITDKPLGLAQESYISQTLESFIHDQKLKNLNFDPDIINALKGKLQVVTQKLENGRIVEQNSSEIKMAIAYIAGFLVYFFIFFFSSQVMKGVVEEKTNRIIEVIITSVKPFQLMVGKIAGIALVGLTQFMIWIILSFAVLQIFSALGSDTIQNTSNFTVNNGIHPNAGSMQNTATEGNSGLNLPAILIEIQSLHLIKIFLLFLFYFIGGYLLNAALFAAVASAADSETDTQQFVMPVMIPQIVSVFVLVNAITNPSGQLAYWFSIIPLTSPVIMMARIPFDVPAKDLILSMSLLIISIILIIWLASKIYRVGILMYGKKPSWGEMIKWIKYKD